MNEIILWAVVSYEVNWDRGYRDYYKTDIISFTHEKDAKDCVRKIVAAHEKYVEYITTNNLDDERAWEDQHGSVQYWVAPKKVSYHTESIPAARVDHEGNLQFDREANYGNES